MQKSNKKKTLRSAQSQQRQPGIESKMKPLPEFENSEYHGSGKLKGKAAVITGGDSGIGRAVAVAFAKEGCDIGIVYLDEHKDAKITKEHVENEGQRCELISGNIREESFCKKAIDRINKKFGKLNIIVNNAAVQFPQKDLTKITHQQLIKTFEINIFSYFYITKAALKYLEEGASIINTTSVTAYRGSANLLDYSSTKGAIVSFTRSLASSLAQKKIRVNGVAPGPIWTPLIPSSFPPKHVATFGSDTPMGRAGQPEEVAPCYVFLASDDSTYMTGQILHPNGGEIVNG
ncbi:MAG TPA: SDR family oxidoreductase [Ignavibacteria bacterium]|nr:SDR family oxidoreductase [Ignavibacteria bacterium]